jgi:hypothetical protein
MGQHPDESDATPHDGERDGALTVPDEQLPEDLQPSDANPLAQPAADEVPDDAVIEGVGHPGSGGGSEDASRGDDDGSGPSSRDASSETGPGDDSGTDSDSDTDS